MILVDTQNPNYPVNINCWLCSSTAALYSPVLSRCIYACLSTTSSTLPGRETA